MSFRTALVSFTNFLKGVPTALHLATLKDTVEADLTQAMDAAYAEYKTATQAIENDLSKAVDAANAEYLKARTAIEETIVNEFDTVKNMVEHAYNRVTALKNAGLLNNLGHINMVSDIEAAYKAIFETK